MADFVSDIAFTPSVKAEQDKRGSRRGYQTMAEKRDWPARITEDLAAFVGERDSFYLATATKDGQPYIQHRGGPKGFLKVLDDRRLAFADFTGNRQYISVGNMGENDKAFIFLMDYEFSRRIKIWGTVRVVEDDKDLLAAVHNPGYGGARPERAFVFTVAAWDVNCPKHIPKKVDIAELEAARARIAALERELDALKNARRS